MAVSKKIITKTQKTNTDSTTLKPSKNLPKNIWLCVALGVLALLSLWVAAARWESLGYLTTSELLTWVVEPAILAILVAIFSTLFIYRSLTRHETPLIATTIAYILLLAVVLALVFVAVLSGRCDSITSNCSADFLFRLSAFYYTFLFIPILSAILAVIGTTALLIGRDNNSTDR